MTSISLAQYERDDEEDEEDDYEGYAENAGGGGGEYARDDVSDDDGQGADQMANLPSELKGLRACMVCTLVKTMNQFLDQGCDNCERFLQVGAASSSHPTCSGRPQRLSRAFFVDTRPTRSRDRDNVERIRRVKF